MMQHDHHITMQTFLKLNNWTSKQKQKRIIFLWTYVNL